MPLPTTANAPPTNSNPTNANLVTNTNLHEKLLDLVTKEDKSSDEWNEEMHSLLSNPEIKVHLRELHSQLTQNPDRFLANLQETLLEKVASQINTSNRKKHQKSREEEKVIRASIESQQKATFSGSMNLTDSESSIHSFDSGKAQKERNQKLMQELLKLHDVYGTKEEEQQRVSTKVKHTSSSRTRKTHMKY